MKSLLAIFSMLFGVIQATNITTSPTTTSTSSTSTTSSASYTYCEDYHACGDDDISTEYALCLGYYACDSATIDSTYAYCSGDLACSGSAINASYIYAIGHESSETGTLAGYDVHAYGHYGVAFADIEARKDTLNLYLYGYYAGYYADILCYDDQTCNIYCGASFGCADANLYCYSGATCTYDCDDDEDYCPTIYTGVSSELTDEQITGIYLANQERKKKRLAEGRSRQRTKEVVVISNEAIPTSKMSKNQNADVADTSASDNAAKSGAGAVMGANGGNGANAAGNGNVKNGPLSEDQRVKQAHDGGGGSGSGAVHPNGRLQQIGGDALGHPRNSKSQQNKKKRASSVIFGFDTREMISFAIGVTIASVIVLGCAMKKDDKVDGYRYTTLMGATKL